MTISWIFAFLASPLSKSALCTWHRNQVVVIVIIFIIIIVIISHSIINHYLNISGPTPCPLPPAPTSPTKNRQSITVCGSCFSLWNVALESKSGTKIKRKRLCKMFLSWKLIAKSISLCSSGWKNHQPSLSWFCEEKNRRLLTAMILGALAITRHKLFKSIRGWCWLVLTDLKLKPSEKHLTSHIWFCYHFFVTYSLTFRRPIQWQRLQCLAQYLAKN